MKLNYNRMVLSCIPAADWDYALKKRFVEVLKEALENNYKISVEIFSVRKIIYDLARQERIPINPDKIHKSSDEELRLLRRMAFKEIGLKLNKSVKDTGFDLSIIETRASSYSEQSKEELLRSCYLEEIKPDLFVTVIDDPVCIYKNIPQSKKTKKYKDHNIGDIIRWMELEVEEMEELAHELDKKLFVIPRRQVNALIDLLLSKRPPAYLSRPMSLAGPQVKERIKLLKNNLKKYFVIFDPECLGTAHTEIKMEDQDQTLYRGDVMKRDEQWLIRINSDYMITYLPERVPAHGSQSELVAASKQGKIVWVVLEPAYTDLMGRLTPFIDQHADLVFVSSQEFGYFLDLPKVQRDIYSELLNFKWNFMRRGELISLMEKMSPDKRASIQKALFEKYREKAQKIYLDGVARKLINPVEQKVLMKMIKDSWESNRPLWEMEESEAVSQELFGRKPIEGFAARESQIPKSDVQSSQMLFMSSNGDLTDEELFVGILSNYAHRKRGKMLFENICSFFRTDDLGSFRENILFLRFIRRTLDKHGYRTIPLLKEISLRSWYREFCSGESEGSKI